MKNFIISFVFLLFAFLTLANANTTTSTTCTVNDLGDETCVTTTTTVTGSGQQTTTGNILTNSTFGTGSTTSTNGWSTDSDESIHTHGNFGNFPYDTNMDQSGGVLAFEGHIEDNVYQDVDLVGDGHLTQSQINEGFTSTQSADVWFWNNIENTLTLKQTITAGDGTVTTQTRIINDHDPNRAFNGGTFDNYTNVYTQNSNSQTDITIRTELYNEGDGSYNDNTHRGPDVDNVELSITTAGAQTTSTSSSSVTTLCQDRVPNACTYDQEAVEEAVDVSTDTGQTYDEYVEEAIQDVNTVEIVNVETSIIVEDDLGIETEMTVEEFVADTFTAVLEENGLQEEFTEALEEEGITEQDFFSAVADEMEAEFGGEVAQEESTEIVEEDAPVEETSTESLNTSEESVESETSTSSETSEPNTQEADSETQTTGSETESEGTTETESSEQEESTGDDRESVEDGGEASTNEQEGDQNEGSGEVEVEEGVSKELEKKIARVIKKLEQKLKNIDQKLKAVSIVTAQIMIEQQPDMSSYQQMQFYDTRKMPDNPDWYAEDTILNAYGRSIYQDKTLLAYQTTDPMFVREQELNRVNNNISQLEAELEILRNENNR
jgi:hypothetical protein